MSANARSEGPWVVVTADMVTSSKIDDMPGVRSRLLKQLSERHLQEGRVFGRYTVTAWDEFQNVLVRPVEIPDVVWDLRLAFRPSWDLKIGIGFGAIDELPGPKTPINEESSGEAFLRAREAVDHLGDAKEKYPLRTYVCSGDPQFDRSLNLIYMLTDSLLLNLSNRQWETIRQYQATGRMELAARRLEVETSTVSRNLQRGYYWQMETARREIRELIEAYLHPSKQKT